LHVHADGRHEVLHRADRHAPVRTCGSLNPALPRSLVLEWMVANADHYDLLLIEDGPAFVMLAAAAA
jgi:hypothetical protein